jgi:hypothetical protein
MSVHEATGSPKEVRRGEGVTLTVTTTNWASDPTPGNISITRASDGGDVTGDWAETATPAASGDVITLPKITVPADAALGRYRVDVPFTANGFAPGIPYIELHVVS